MDHAAVGRHEPVILGQAPWQPIATELAQWLKDNAPGLSADTYNSPSLPAAEALNAGFSQRNANGKPLRFVAQDEHLPYPQMAYEARIWQYGLIATRTNWHDFFNAIVWRAFPRTKAALNAVHWREMQRQTDNRRSPRRDALTLFDECGVLLLDESGTHLQDATEHRWRRLFAEHRACWGATGGLQVLTFGHAMYEKYRQAYVGMTAKALLVQVPSGFIRQLAVQPQAARGQLDGWLAKAILSDGILCHSRELSPLPVLGIPGWWTNRPADFLANTDYFRPPGLSSGERKVLDLTNEQMTPG